MCCETLIKEKKQYYTFDSTNTKIVKLVIYGLPVRTTDVLLEDLKEKEATPLNIRPMNTKDKNPNHQLYIFQYEKNSAEFKKFRTLNNMCRVVFQWKYYKNNSRSVPQLWLFAKMCSLRRRTQIRGVS
jgi:hypothetical protein